MITKVFLEAVRNEVLGFSFGSPWRYDKNSITCVLPIIRESDEEPQYLVLAAAKKVEIKDTGHISDSLVINNEDKPVFLRMGELLKGDTQNRTLTISRLIMPGQETKVEVACVHASKGIVANATFVSSGYTPQRDRDYAQSYHQTGNYSQSMSWQSDQSYHATIKGGNIMSGNILFGQTSQDDLTQVRDQYNEVVKDILREVPLFDNQIGMALIDTKGFYSLDCFDLHQSWKAVKEAMVGKESLSITSKEEEGVFIYKPKKAKLTVKKALERGYEEKSQYKEDRTETLTLDFSKYIGEVVLLDGEVIHLLIARK